MNAHAKTSNGKALAAARGVKQNPSFFFCTGIENSYPTIAAADGGSERVDEMASTGHYGRWREDFQLVLDLGIGHLRYGAPHYRAYVGPGRFDWDFTDETYHALHSLGIWQIVDLCHFGVPDWIGNFQNPDFPSYFAEYARAVALRYPWLRMFTPINEMLIAAEFSAKLGFWNERLCSDRAFVTALKHIVKANVLASEAILQVCPDAKFVQSETTQYYHPFSPDALPVTAHLNERRFLSFDLNYGHPPSATMLEYLLDNGMSREEFHFFMNRNVRSSCIMGTDYYEVNEHIVYPDGSTVPCNVLGYYGLTRQYYTRYRLPIMHTETNIAQERGSTHWLERQWANVLRLKEEGYPIIGFTWYSLIDQVDWDVGLRCKRGVVNSYGLYDIDRRIRPAGQEYKRIIDDWSAAVSERYFDF
jgi:beta-glucosidase/6-phospho-beta-glucosidase/beta-galactosidase